MKKVAMIIVFVFFLVLLPSCETDNSEKVSTDMSYKNVQVAHAVHFDAVVVESGEKSMLVEITDTGTSNISLGSKAWISSSEGTNIDYSKYVVGDSLYVEFDGAVMESYPLQINSVTYTSPISISEEYEALIVDELPNGFIALDKIDLSDANLRYIFWESQISFISTVDNYCVYQTDIKNKDFIVKYNNKYYINEKIYNDILNGVNNKY